MRFELFRVCAPGSWVIDANMRRKLSVALQLEVAHHFIERCADAPVGLPEGLNRQPHSEQPKPRKRSCSIHTSLRSPTL